MVRVFPTIARAALVLGCVTSVVACHRSRKGVTHGGGGAVVEPTEGGDPGTRVDEIVKWDTTLSEDMPGLVPAFVNRAHQYGCAIHRAEPDAAVATCDGVRIAMAKSNLTVSVGCRGVTLEECRALFKRVVETSGATPPPPGAPSAPPPAPAPSGLPPGGVSI